MTASRLGCFVTLAGFLAISPAQACVKVVDVSVTPAYLRKHASEFKFTFESEQDRISFTVTRLLTESRKTTGRLTLSQNGVPICEVPVNPLVGKSHVAYTFEVNSDFVAGARFSLLETWTADVNGKPIPPAGNRYLFDLAALSESNTKRQTFKQKLLSVVLTFGAVPAETSRAQEGRNMLGHSLKEIIPPKKIKRIVRIEESRLADRFRKGIGDGEEELRDRKIQEGCDAFVQELFNSNEKSQEASLSADEGKLATLLVLTTDYRLFSIEVIGGGFRGTSIIVNGLYAGVRIPVSE